MLRILIDKTRVIYFLLRMRLLSWRLRAAQRRMRIANARMTAQLASKFD